MKNGIDPSFLTFQARFSRLLERTNAIFGEEKPYSRAFMRQGLSRNPVYATKEQYLVISV